MNKEVEKIIGHSFKEGFLLDKALTHPSATKDNVHYERLEFLGDAVLDIVISEYLFNRYADEQEGALAKRRAALVRGDTLAKISKELGLGDYLKLGPGELAAGGKEQKTNLANVFEAILGAMYLDAGLQPVKQFLLTIYEPLAEKMAEPPKDAKTALQEWAQAHGKPLPDYALIEQSGPAHAPNFVIEVRVEGLQPQQAAGASKRKAEQTAAKNMIAALPADE